MSLINDALKRANEQKAKQPTPAELGAELQTIETGTDQTRLWPIGLFAVCLVGSLWFGWMWWHGEGAQTAEGLGADRAEVAARSPSVSPDASATGEGADAPAEGSYVTQELPKIPRKPKQAPPLIATPVLNPTPQPGIAPNAPVPPPPSPPIASHATQAPQRENPTPVASTSRTAPALTRAPAPLPAPVVAAPQPTAPPQTTFPALTLQGIYYRPTRPAAVINSRTVYVGDRISNTKVLAIDRHEVTVQWNNQVRVLAFQ